MTLHSDWNYPNRIRVGAGRARELPAACREVGMARPLLVTDPVLGGTEMVRRAVAACRNEFGHCGLFDNIKSNPTADNVADGVAAFREGRHDGVILFGGGSVLDAGKAIAFVSGQRYPLWDYQDNRDDRDAKVDPAGIAPCIALPTTAGTGSEVGRASVITDSASRVKRTVMHLLMMPRIAFLDPDLTAGMPAPLAAATGADALTHCIESLCSPVYHPMAQAIALEGLRIIRDSLPRAVADTGDAEARQAMLIASSLGAVSFQRGLGGVHAIAQSLGALYDKHHGLLNAILLPYVLEANRPAIEDGLAMLARYIGLPRPGFTAVMDWVLGLRHAIGIPHSLGEIGIEDEDAELVGRMSLADGCADTNPVPHCANAYAAIFRRAVAGV